MTRRVEFVHLQVEKRREVKISYTSKVFLQQEPKQSNANGDPTSEEVASYTNKTPRSSSRCAASAGHIGVYLRNVPADNLCIF